MRSALFWAAVTVYTVAQVLSGCLLGICWLGLAAFLLWHGAIFWFVLWILFGTVAAVLAISLLRLPFVLLGFLLALLAGRTDDYWHVVRETNR